MADASYSTVRLRVDPITVTYPELRALRFMSKENVMKEVLGNRDGEVARLFWKVIQTRLSFFIVAMLKAITYCEGDGWATAIYLSEALGVDKKAIGRDMNYHGRLTYTVKGSSGVKGSARWKMNPDALFDYFFETSTVLGGVLLRTKFPNKLLGLGFTPGPGSDIESRLAAMTPPPKEKEEELDESEVCWRKPLTKKDQEQVEQAWGNGGIFAMAPSIFDVGRTIVGGPRA